MFFCLCVRFCSFPFPHPPSSCRSFLIARIFSTHISFFCLYPHPPAATRFGNPAANGRKRNATLISTTCPSCSACNFWSSKWTWSIHRPFAYAKPHIHTKLRHDKQIFSTPRSPFARCKYFVEFSCLLEFGNVYVSIIGICKVIMATGLTMTTKW